MNFTREKIKDFYLLDSKIENIFINEYMPAAPGDFVKVFLYGCMYAEYGIFMDNETLAKQLGVSEKKVQEAWNYWEEMGAVKKHYIETLGKFNYSIEFVNLKELMYGKSNGKSSRQEIASTAISSETEESGELATGEIKEILSTAEKTFARSLSPGDIETISGWITEDHASPDFIEFALEYCQGKEKMNIKYIDKVIKGWISEGINSVKEAEDHLTEIDQKYYRYKRVMKALGFSRNATEAERAIIDNWFEAMKFTMDKVLEACKKTSGISNPNINYVNKVLTNWQKGNFTGIDDSSKGHGKVVPGGALNQYYEYLRTKAEAEAEARKKEVYETIPKIEEIDSQIKKLSSMLSKTMIMGANGKKEGNDIRKTMDKLTCDRAVILTENNYEMDYTDVRYLCDKCNDTGTTDNGVRCTCIKQRTEEAEQWQNKSLT